MAIVAALALALGLAACGDGDGDSGDTTEGGDATLLDVAYVTSQDHPYGLAIDSFAEEVNAGGQLTIIPQPVYPESEVQLLDDVRIGVVPMATVSTATFDTAGITAFQALQAPFLITNYPLAEAVEGGDIGKSMLADANRQAGDVVALAIHEGGLRKPFGVKPLRGVADYKGATIGAPQSQVLAAGLEAIGANVEPLPLPDIYQALQTGTVDGVEADPSLIYTEKWYEVARYVTGNVNLWPFPAALVINKEVYDGLSADQQKALRDAAANTTASSIEIFTTPGSPIAQDLVNCGVEYVSSTRQQLTELQNASAKAVGQLSPESQKYVTQIEAEKEALGPPPAQPPPPTSKTGECAPPGG
ncbi:MAG TPA: TRAP transporter substrate-binding protein [Actinomycetes bacterium]|nr:TRAP transporter substrate-binding protein [Actinomycetes bacterium]